MGGILNEEIGNFSDESEKADDISSDIEIEFLGSDGNNEISSARQIVTAKCTKVTWRKQIVNWKLMENQNMVICILLIQSFAFNRNCTYIWLCFAIWGCCVRIYELFATTPRKMNEFVKKHALRTQIGKKNVRKMTGGSKLPCIALVVMMLYINRQSI